MSCEICCFEQASNDRQTPNRPYNFVISFQPCPIATPIWRISRRRRRGEERRRKRRSSGPGAKLVQIFIGNRRRAVLKHGPIATSNNLPQISVNMCCDARSESSTLAKHGLRHGIVAEQSRLTLCELHPDELHPAKRRLSNKRQ